MTSLEGANPWREQGLMCFGRGNSRILTKAVHCYFRVLTPTLHQQVKLRLSLVPEMHNVPPLMGPLALTTSLLASSSERWTEVRGPLKILVHGG